jgi:glycine dehydrogenase subunit 2
VSAVQEEESVMDTWRQARESKLAFEKGKAGKRLSYVPKPELSREKEAELVPEKIRRRRPAMLPSLAEPEVIRHFLTLSQKNFAVDTNFYPLGSCTMKYNPKLNEDMAAHPSFGNLHPYQPEETVQGILRLFYELEQWLKALTGMDRFSLQPAAGAQGELLGMMITKAYHRSAGDGKRRKIIVPDSSHGTNPASAALYGYEVVTLPSNERGRVDLRTLERAADDATACLMLTNPNTLGLFEDEILEIQKIIHERGALLYYDGANMNALLGIARPGDMGFDIVHLNLHKTFSTPHGGGGPGAGPVGVKQKLAKFLPAPLVAQEGERYFLDYDLAESVGKLKAFYGNAGMLVRAYTFIRRHGIDGLKQVSRDAILNANYVRARLSGVYVVPYPEFCMHEFVASAQAQTALGVRAGDIAKRLLDFGFYAPTVYFPLIVKEAMMIEPTETESKEALDAFVNAMLEISQEAAENPDKVKLAPHTLPVSRPDEVACARDPILTYRELLARK